MFRREDKGRGGREEIKQGMRKDKKVTEAGKEGSGEKGRKCKAERSHSKGSGVRLGVYRQEDKGAGGRGEIKQGMRKD